MRCPACDHENIPGQDLCASCGLDLAGLDVQAWGVSPQDPLLSMSVSDLPLKDPVTVTEAATVADAVTLMQKRREGCTFVLAETGELLGVFTERDLATRVLARGKAPETTRIREVMTPSPFAIRRDDALTFALHRMGVDGYRHVPVLDAGKLVGFLSMRNVLVALAES